MSKLDPKIVAISAAALLVAGALGFAVAQQLPTEQRGPLAVVTLDRAAEQAVEQAGADLTEMRTQRDNLATQLEAMTGERDQALNDLEAARAAPPETQDETGTETGADSAELAAATSERDALAAELETLRAELASQAAALESAVGETEALKQAVAEAQAESERQAAAAAAAEASRQQAEEAAVTTATPPTPTEPAEPAVASLSDAEIESAVEQGLRAYQAKNFKAAFETWQPLADQGVARAQFYIGALYRDGAGVNRDMVQAYVWLKRSDERGYIYAKGLLDRVSKEMSAGQMAEAEAVLGQ